MGGTYEGYHGSRGERRYSEPRPYEKPSMHWVSPVQDVPLGRENLKILHLACTCPGVTVSDDAILPSERMPAVKELVLDGYMWNHSRGDFLELVEDHSLRIAGSTNNTFLLVQRPIELCVGMRWSVSTMKTNSNLKNGARRVKDVAAKAARRTS